MPDHFRFGCFELRPTERRLLENGRAVALGARAFDVLLALIERRDRLVSKSELLDLVWPGLVVEEGNLPVQVSGLRKLIGNGTIATVPGLGYRFAMAIDDEPAAVLRDAQHNAQPTARTNVPAAIDVLLGREADIDTLGQWLGEHRLVTVLGAGGIGKTRLAQAVARAVLDNHPDGVWWVDVAALSSPDKVVPSIASAAQLQLGEGDAQAQLVRALGSREMLLVLDNCEHLAEPVARIVHALLAGAAGVRVLTTSQEALRVEGEHLYMLSPLAVPPLGVSLATARGFAAVQLLERRARATDARFSLTVDNVDLAIDLCRQLDGVALAIEMAAARLPLLGLDGLHQRLGERLSLLRTTSRDAPSRQRTLRATLDWSHALLDANESAVLRRLAVFVGSFRLDAAQQTAAFAGFDDEAVLDALVGLVDKSLVKIEQIEPPRYRLAETTRLYASERLREAQEVDAAQRCHDQAMARLADEDDVRWQDREAHWLARYGPDYDDAAEAFERACKLRDARVAGVTALFLRSLDECRGTLVSSERRVVAAHTLLASAVKLDRARLCLFIASCAWVEVAGVPGLKIARTAVQLWRGIGDMGALHTALLMLALRASHQGALKEARAALDEARALETPAWPRRLRGLTALQESSIAGLDDDAIHCAERARDARALFLSAGSPGLAAYALDWLADAELRAGRVQESLAHSETAVEELHALGHPNYLSLALVTRCRGLLIAEDFAGAWAAAREAVGPLSERDQLGTLGDGFALLAALRGHAQEAAQLLGHADASRRLHRQLRHRPVPAIVQSAAALVGNALGPINYRLQREAGEQLSTAQVLAIVQELVVGTQLLSSFGPPIPSAKHLERF